MISSTARSRRRNRHGRRLPILRPHLPAWKSNREEFDLMIIESVRRLRKRLPEISQIEFAVEEVPVTDPLPWETSGAVLGRSFEAQRGIRPRPQVVLYRLPISQRCENRRDLTNLTYIVLVENIATALGIRPSKIDPRWTD